MTEPATFKDIGLVPFGSRRCEHCGNPTALRQYKHKDGTYILHSQCAKAFFDALNAAPEPPAA
jgi:CRISPR/Cas system-associated protein Cas10 (large subunit of type III CRISPR-Cas system)